MQTLAVLNVDNVEFNQQEAHAPRAEPRELLPQDRAPPQPNLFD